MTRDTECYRRVTPRDRGCGGRYTYLFPAPYPGPAQDSASRFQDFADTAGGGAFFGPTPSSDEGVPQSQSSGMVGVGMKETYVGS